MIRAFGLDNARLISVDETNPTLLNDAIWIDLIDPSEAERTVLENRLDQTLAEERELEDLEASARFLKMKTVCTCILSFTV
ncbi:magnesium transporter [Mannheimia haemolytica]|nr:magnesium transporter [Mannheimia haemolytica]